MNSTNEHSPKEQWEDEVLSSIEGIQRSEAPPFLFMRIQSRIQSRFHGSDKRIAAPILALSLVAFVILCCVNVWMLVDLEGTSSANANMARPQASSILETASFDLY
jgi:hypothetical protein